MTGAEAKTREAVGANGVQPRFVPVALAWVVSIAVLWGVDLLTKIAERNASGAGKDDFRLVSEQVTSALAVLLMVLFVVHWVRRYPLRRDAWIRAFVGHAVASMAFALGHHVLMILLRLAWYAAHETSYEWRRSFLSNLITEYQKDVKVYFGMVLVIWAYGLWRRSRSGVPGLTADRLVVQTGTSDRVLELADIECLEAARNYVSVHAGGREYVIRQSIHNLVRKLPAAQFKRVHRSFIVNLASVREIRTVDSNLCVVLASGRQVPVSRSYRDSFRAQIRGDQSPAG